MAAQFSDFRPGRRWRALGWVLLAGLLLRFAYFVEHGASPFFNVPLLDEKFYDSAAAGLLGGGDLAELNPAFRSLGYPAFLAACYWLGGDSGRILAVAAQHLLGLGTALLAAWLAFRLFRSPAAAAVAAALYLFAGPPLYFEGELLAETLFTFEMALVAVLLARCFPDRGRLAPWLLAGAAIGLAAQTRPNALVAVGALVLLAAWGRPAGRRLSAAAAGSLATLALLFGCAALQMPWVGRFELLPSQGGVNLYLGNKRGADGMIPRQASATTYGDAYRDSVQLWSEEVFRQERGRPPASPAELSRFWTAKTAGEIAAAPGAWLRLLGRKTLYLFSNTEIPNNKSYEFAQIDTRLLAFLLRFFILASFAGAGIAAATRGGDRATLAAILLLALMLALGAIAFFVNARFRLPLWPLMAALGGGALLTREEGRRAFWAATAGSALGVLSALAPPWPDQLPGLGRDYFFRSLASFEKGDFVRSREDARIATSLEPDDAAAKVQLGNAALAQGDREVAYRAFSQAVALLPAEPRGFHNLGLVFERLDKPGDAYAAYLRAIELSADFSPPYAQAALLEIRAGLLDRAEAHLDHLAGRGYDSLTYTCARAFLQLARGDREAAQRLLVPALRLDRAAVEDLVRQNSVPLRFEDGLLKRRP